MNLITKTETITFGEKKVLGIFKKDIKFKVVADIPDSMLDNYAKISKLKSEEMDSNPEVQKEAFNIMKTVIREMLYTHNSKGAVDKYVNGLGIQGTNKIFVFLNEYVNEVSEEKKNE